MIRKIYKLSDNKKQYVSHRILGGFESTTDKSRARVFNLENENDKKIHNFIISKYGAKSEVIK